MEEIYYVDRPTIPATSQVIVKIESLFEEAVKIHALDIENDYVGDVVEVKDATGEVIGTLVFFPDVSYADLVAPDVLAEKEVFEEEPVSETAQEYDSCGASEVSDVAEPTWNPFSTCSAAVAGADIEHDGQDHILEAIRHNRLLNLELELSAAKQRVQDLVDEIVDEEGALD